MGFVRLHWTGHQGRCTNNSCLKKNKLQEKECEGEEGFGSWKTFHARFQQEKGWNLIKLGK